MLIAEGRDPKQAAAIAYEKAGRKPKANAQELTYEYLKAFYDHVLEHPAILKEFTDEIHIKSRAKAGGQLHVKKEEEAGQADPMHMKVNASSFGGKVIEENEEITVIPAVLMAEGVRNGGLHRYEDFSKDVRWFEGVPIVPPHDPTNPAASLVNQHTSKLGQIRNVKLNADKRRVEAEAVLFNSKFDPNDLARIKTGEAFGGSIGFWADDVPEGGEWSDGTKYDRIEKNFFGNHFAIVSNPACPLGKCGFNVNAKEPDNMVEPVITPPAGNPAPTVAPPIAEPLKVNALTEEKLTGVFSAFELKMNARFDAIDATIAAKDAEIKTLKAAEEVRVNAKNAAEDALVLSTLDSLLLPAFKDKKAELFPAFKTNAALFIAQNPDKIDLAAFTKPPVITPSGQAFVPHANASEDEELKGLMPTDEEAGMRKVA
jgi:hypothetical protein